LGALTWKNAVSYVAHRCRLIALGGFVLSVAGGSTTRASKSAPALSRCAKFAAGSFMFFQATHLGGQRSFVQMSAGE